MKLGTRLLVTFLPTIAVVMTGYGYWALHQREALIIPEARRETQAYSTVLGVALEQAFGDLEAGAVQEVINRISAEPQIYGVVVYDTTGSPLLTSFPDDGPAIEPVAQLSQVLTGGVPMTFERTIGEQRVFSVVRPLRTESGALMGALEVAEPLDFVDAEKSRIRQRFMLNTLTLIVALSVVSLLLVDRSVAQPMRRFVAAVQALGSGELGHRVMERPRARELADLTQEFNRMAANLETARRDLIREADERIALERSLRQTEQMAAVGKLAAGLAHEIAAPLNVISGRAEMLLKSGEYLPHQERNLRIIVDQIGRITSIVRSLLDFSRRREPLREPSDPAVILEGALEFLDGEFRKAGVEVSRETQLGLSVEADRDQLHQVFVNLLLNAVQASEQVDGERRITVRLYHHDSQVALGGRTESVVVEVLDNGPGISDTARDRMFEPFFTTKPRGTGFGLVVARSIVEEHGGSIEAANRTDCCGARLRVALPSAPSAATANV